MATTLIYKALLGVLGSVHFAQAGIIAHRHHHHPHVPRNSLFNVDTQTHNETAAEALFARGPNDDPADFSWIKKFAVVGDSFSAGIGAGNPMGTAFSHKNDWDCSRYDHAYGQVLKRGFGKSVEDFQFVACSGDRTEDIYTQVNNMKGDLDLVVMTAGGNDLCLADMIKACVFVGSDVDACQTVIDLASRNLDNILENNVKEVLRALNNKMKNNGVVIYNGYAKFFDTKKDNDCNDQDWTLIPVLGTAMKLTKDRREKFNKLVVRINDLLKDAVSDIAKESGIKYKIKFSNWDPWVRDGVEGQYCSDKSSGKYPDPDQPDLHFFKPNTQKSESDHDGDMKRRSDPDPRLLEGMSELAPGLSMGKVYRSSLFNSRNPDAVARSKLDPRAPTAPGCPSDGSSLPSIPVPDSVGKNFHPNELGHVTIASFAAAAIMDARAEILAKTAPTCELVEEFNCWQDQGSQTYANWNRMEESRLDFCNKDMRLMYRGQRTGYVGGYTYFEGSADEISFAVHAPASAINSGDEALRSECRDSFNRLIHGCDGNDPNNPLNWKFGGQYTRGKTTWTVTAKGQRKWPMAKEPGGKCEGWYKFGASHYEIYGYGSSGHDYGQKTLQPSIKDCIGSQPSDWKFDYISPPTKEGYEWKSTFKTPIWVRQRCFNNNKVQFGAGGFSGGCGGND